MRPNPSNVFHAAGNWITASGHLITVMVGAGVLSLPAAMSWLGWVGGLVSLLLFYAISLWCSLMLAAVYKVDGHRHPTYSQAVLSILGRLDSRVLVVVQQIMLCLAAIGYAIAAADSMTFMAAQSCAQGQECVGKHWQMALIFGGEAHLCCLLPCNASNAGIAAASPRQLCYAELQHTPNCCSAR